MESRIRETLESWVLESGIQFKESGIRNPSSTTKNPESIIQDCLRFPYTGQCGSCSQMKSLGEWHAFGSSVLNIVHNQLVLLIMSRQAWFVEGEVVIIIIKKVSRLLLGVKWEKRCWFKFGYLYAGGSKMVTFFLPASFSIVLDDSWCDVTRQTQSDDAIWPGDKAVLLLFSCHIWQLN